MVFKSNNIGLGGLKEDADLADLEPIIFPQLLQTMARDAYGHGEILLDSKLHLEGVGPLNVTLSNESVVWQGIGGGDHNQEGHHVKLLETCGTLPLSEVYAVEKCGYGPVATSKLTASFEGLVSQVPQGNRVIKVGMSLRQRAFADRTKRRELSPATYIDFGQRRMHFHRFIVHTFVRATNSSGQWIPKEYTFGHESEDVCMLWFNRIKELLEKFEDRPRKLLVIVNPYGGRKHGTAKWKQVAPIFEKAGIETTVITTTHRGHAREIMEQASEEELLSRDGVVVVGGDGHFNEVLNGLASKYHHPSPAPMPYKRDKKTDKQQTSTSSGFRSENIAHDSHVSTVLQSPGKHVAGLLGTSSDGYKRLEVDTEKISGGRESDVRPVSRSSQEGTSPIHTNDTNLEAGNLPSTSANPKNWSNMGTGIDGEWTSKGKRHCDENRLARNSNKLSSNGNFVEDNSFQSEADSDSGPDQGRHKMAEKIIGDASPMSVNESSIERNISQGSGLLLTPDFGLTIGKRKLRIGIIPAGSTDTIVMSTTGSRDHVTAALHIVLGDRMPLDIVRITGWKESRHPLKDEKRTGPKDETPTVRYAASFCGYGFYGDVARESEHFRWMGPARYDYAGFMTYLRHRKYEAEVSFLEMPKDFASRLESSVLHGPWPGGAGGKRVHHKKHTPDRVICRVGCSTCAAGRDLSYLSEISDNEEREEEEKNGGSFEGPRWTTIKGNFHSVGAAVMSCRNEKAPDGVAAHAHLADGRLHLILIRECSRAEYLLQLLRLTRKGADPLDFKFVEFHQTPAFTFVSHGSESVWNVDGELFPAHQLSAQVFRGLVDLFARGPEN